jgi:hypothetical protein
VQHYCCHGCEWSSFEVTVHGPLLLWLVSNLLLAFHLLKFTGLMYHSVQNVLSSHLVSKTAKVKIHKTIILPVFYGCEIWPHIVLIFCSLLFHFVQLILGQFIMPNLSIYCWYILYVLSHCLCHVDCLIQVWWELFTVYVRGSLVVVVVCILVCVPFLCHVVWFWWWAYVWNCSALFIQLSFLTIFRIFKESSIVRYWCWMCSMC